jgi:hypothetical protein
LFFRAAEMDAPEKWHDLLTTVAATPANWDALKGLLTALERGQVRDLKTRPLEIGRGPSG